MLGTSTDIVATGKSKPVSQIINSSLVSGQPAASGYGLSQLKPPLIAIGPLSPFFYDVIF